MYLLSCDDNIPLLGCAGRAKNASGKIHGPPPKWGAECELAGREEALKLQPHQADHGDQLVLKGSWPKGGRPPREIPIRTLAQRDVLDRAKALVKFRSASLIPPHKTYEHQQHSYESPGYRAGLNKMHGRRRVPVACRRPTRLAGR